MRIPRTLAALFFLVFAFPASAAAQVKADVSAPAAAPEANLAPAAQAGTAFLPASAIVPAPAATPLSAPTAAAAPAPSPPDPATAVPAEPRRIPFVAALRRLGASEELTSRLVSFLADRRSDAADITAGAVDGTDLPANRKILLIFAASLQGVGPDLADDAMARSLISDFGVRFGFTADQVKTLIAGDFDARELAEAAVAKRRAEALVSSARAPPDRPAGTFVLGGENLSPTFDVPDSPSRDRVAAESLLADAAEVARALQGVELPPVLAYKTAGLALRDDLQGSFSEIGAAQKIAEQIYKIRGQKILASSLSLYAREASDDRYSPPLANPTSEDYTSAGRLRQQLSSEYSELLPVPGKLKFVAATTARTSWGNGHAWLGIRAQLAANQAPVDLMLHARLLDKRTRNQKDALGALGINALFGVYNHIGDLGELIRGLGDGISAKDLSIDYMSVTMPDGSERVGLEGNLDLLRAGLTRQLLLAPGGVPVAPAQTARERKYARWSVLSKGKSIGIVAPTSAIPPQDEPVLVQVMNLDEYASGPRNSWTLITSSPKGAVVALKEMLFPAQRAVQPAPPSAPRGRIDEKAKTLNSKAWIKGIFTDIGGYQSAATRLFEASNPHSIYAVFSYPDASAARGRYGPQGTSSDLEYLKKALGDEFERIRIPRAAAEPRRFVLATRASEDQERLHGYVGIRLQNASDREAADTVVRFDFRGGTWQKRRDALATLGVNLLFFSRYEPSREDFLKSLYEDLPKVEATIEIVEK